MCKFCPSNEGKDLWKACECPANHRECLEKDIVRRFSQADAGFKICYTCRKPFQFDNAGSAWLRGLLVGEAAVEEAKARRDAAMDKVEWQDVLLGIFAFLAMPAIGFTAFWVGRWSSSCPAA